MLIETKYVVKHNRIAGNSNGFGTDGVANQGDILTAAELRDAKVDVARLLRVGAIAKATEEDIAAFEGTGLIEEDEDTEEVVDANNAVAERNTIATKARPRKKLPNPAETADVTKQAADTTGNQVGDVANDSDGDGVGDTGDEGDAATGNETGE